METIAVRKMQSMKFQKKLKAKGKMAAGGKVAPAADDTPAEPQQEITTSEVSKAAEEPVADC
jgi:hypothetical protein